MTWTVLPLEHACELITDGTHFSPPTNARGDFLYITSKNIRTGRMDLKDISYVTADAHAEIYKGCPVMKGDVLFVKDGVNTGTAAINELEQPFSMLSSVALLRPQHDKLDASYLMHWLNSPHGQGQMLRNMSGAAIKRLVLRQIRASEIPLPSLPKQRRIAAILDAADALRQKRRQALHLLDQLAQSMFTEMFGDPVTNSKRWDESHTLSDYAEIASGVTKGRRLNGTTTREVPYLAVPDYAPC